MVELYGVRFPLAQRPVSWRGITPFPQKVVIGDYSRADHVLESELIFSDFTGGIGVQWARPERHQDRYWFGTLDGRYRYLTLPPERVARGNPGLVSRFLTYNEKVFAVAGNRIVVWDEDGGDWVEVTTFLGAPQDAVVYDGRLYVLTTADLVEYDSATDTTTIYSGDGGFALVVWDDKLFRLDAQNRFWWTITPINWQDAGRLLLPSGWCRQLLVYPDPSGELAIHAICIDGVRIYDFAAERFYETAFRYPATSRLGRAAVWRGELYVPVGQTIYKYNGSSVQVVGPDRDDGLPSHVSGDVVQVVPSHGYWFAVLASVPVQEGGVSLDDWDLGFTNLPFGNFPGASFSAALLTSPGVAFHVLTQFSTLQAIGDVAALSSRQYQLWISTSEGVYTIDLPVGLHNPLQNPTQRYAESGYLVTSWWDVGWSNLEKLALSLVVNAVVPLGGKIRISAGFDEDESWEPICEVTSTGRFRYRVGPPEGRKFRQVRFLIEMERGSDATQAPYLRELTLTYLRVPQLLFGWELTLMLSDPHCRELVGVPAAELIQQLFTIARSRQAGTLRYYDPELGEIDRRVFLTELAGTEIAGPHREGRYVVSVVELES